MIPPHPESIAIEKSSLLTVPKGGATKVGQQAEGVGEL